MSEWGSFPRSFQSRETHISIGLDIARPQSLSAVTRSSYTGSRRSSPKSMTEAAAVLGEAIGRPVRIEAVPWDAFRAGAGEEIFAMLRWFEDVGYDADVAALRRDHPWLTDLPTWAAAQDWTAR